ncbi:Rad21/Rec8-like protein [Ascosphaera apis ARSEF 7405]|uniref:Rad21/Rec8-like protein n=1 Tax=Ascosphaera apis ARSEF 7405 TaxID=392613 RepID=A0A168CYH9_9EURO|nr:Rad21/Rec8-like protein [Ascosphaera apis ARSEF 7405]
MFYSETLLSKTGPLARVWLSANLERKLSKSHILQSDIESSVNAIVDQGQAPMALRLSGQLLLGVVRIYSRKTRYLLDDCNEALMKIKWFAFRLTNNNDLSSSVVLPSGSLTLPDVLTESDLFTNLDPSILFSQSATPAVKPPLSSAGWSSNLLTDSQSIPARKDPVPSELPHLEDDTGLVLDLGEDEYPLGHDPDMSIEVGRDAPAPRPVGEDLFSDQPFDGDLDLDLGEGNNAGINKSSVLGDKDHDDLDNFLLQNDESRLEDTVMGGMDDPATAALAEDSTILPADEDIDRQRTMSRSASPLSEARSSVVRELEETFVDNENENESAAAPQRVKRRRLLHADEATFISKEQLKQQREDRSKILKPSSDLPRDLTWSSFRPHKMKKST